MYSVMRVCKALLGIVVALLLFVDMNSYAVKRVNQVKVVVFDFDLTITDKHSCKFYCGDLISSASQNAFKGLVEKLQNEGVEVAIASFGFKKTISEEMNKIFGDNSPFTESNVITPGDISPTWAEGSTPPQGYSKNHMLERIKKHYGVAHNREIVLIDDTLANIQQAKKEDYEVLPIPGTKPMYQIVSSIEQWFFSE